MKKLTDKFTSMKTTKRLMSNSADSKMTETSCKEKNALGCDDVWHENLLTNIII